MSYGCRQASDGAVVTPRALKRDRTNLIFEDMVSHMTINRLTQKTQEKTVNYKMSYGCRQASDGAVVTPRALKRDRMNLIFEDMVSHMTINRFTQKTQEKTVNYKMSYGCRQASDGAVVTPRALKMDRTNLIFEDMVSHMTINRLTQKTQEKR